MSAGDEARGSRVRELSFALIELVIVAVCIYAFGAFATEHDLDGKLLQYRLLPMFFNTGEGRVATAYLLTGVPAILLLARAVGRLRPSFGEGVWLARAAERPRISAAVLAGVAALLTSAVAWKVLRYTPLTDDEWVYLFQAKCILSGHLSATIPHSPELFHYDLTIVTADGRLAGVYPPGQPVLLALGMLVGQAHLTQVLCVGAIVYTVARIGADLGDVEVGLLAGALAALSPFFLCAGATFHNSVPAALFCVVGLRGALASERHWMWAVVTGGAVGAAFLCRPLEGVVLAAAAFTLLALARPRSRFFVAAVAALPFAALYFASNAAITGHATVPAYAVLARAWPSARIFGFGRGAFGFEHTPDGAFSKTLVAIARTNLWLFGWPLSLSPLLLPAFNVSLGRRYLPAVALAALIFVAYFFYAASPVHDVGSIYHLSAAPMLVLLSAAALLSVRRALESRWPLRIAAAATMITVIAFWPLQLVQLATTASHARASIDATANHATPMLVFFRARPVTMSRSWVFYHPLPSPRFDDPVLFVRDQGRNVDYVRRFPGRTAYRAEPRPDGSVELIALVTGEL